MYDSEEDFMSMVSNLQAFEGEGEANRVYYFAIPPEVFLQTAKCIKVSIIPTTS